MTESWRSITISDQWLANFDDKQQPNKNRMANR